MVAERLGHEARSGALFVSSASGATPSGVLFFDGTAICLFYKRLDKGTFLVPVAPEERALDLLDGIDLEAPSRSRGRDVTH